MDIVIRRAEPSDSEAICQTFREAGAYSGTLQLPFPSAELWRKRLAEPVEGEYVLVALLEGRHAGHAGLHRAGTSPRRAHAMSLGLTVRDDCRGKGVGAALMAALVDLADNWLNVIRLELTVYVDNAPAMALYRNAGFEVEGTHRAYALRDGRYVDAHCMARIRPKPAPV
jgi:putative acetyltransferase